MIVNLRKATCVDVTCLKELAKEFAAENPSDSSTARKDLKNSSEAVTRLLADNHVEVLVAEVTSHIVGCVIFSSMPSLVHGGRLLVFVDLVVVKNKYRRQGIGKQLMSAVMEFASRNNAYKIVLTTRFNNVAALALHRSCGLQKNGLAMAFYATSVRPSETDGG